MEIAKPLYSYAEINLSSLKRNYGYLCSLNKGKIPICVLKDDAYGHGIAECARALWEEGARHFAAACVREAVKIRKSGIDGEVLILGYVANEDIPTLLKEDISACVYSVSFAKMLNAKALERGIRAKAHIALNTGLNRLGFDCTGSAFKNRIRQLAALEGLDICGAYTHYAAADEKDEAGCRQQQRIFEEGLRLIRGEGLFPDTVHVSNSAAAMWLGCACENAFRAGISLFGVSPLPEGENENRLYPVMSFKTRVVNIVNVKKGSGIGYGGNFTAQRDMRLAILCAGFAQGYFRGLSKGAYALLHGRRAAVAGSVCMDMMSVDITEIEGVHVGDEAELFGQGIKVRELSGTLSTVCDELLCAVGRNAERVYI